MFDIIQWQTDYEVEYYYYINLYDNRNYYIFIFGVN